MFLVCLDRVVPFVLLGDEALACLLPGDEGSDIDLLRVASVLGPSSSSSSSLNVANWFVGAVLLGFLSIRLFDNAVLVLLLVAATVLHSDLLFLLFDGIIASSPWAACSSKAIRPKPLRFSSLLL